MQYRNIIIGCCWKEWELSTSAGIICHFQLILPNTYIIPTALEIVEQSKLRLEYVTSQLDDDMKHTMNVLIENEISTLIFSERAKFSNRRSISTADGFQNIASRSKDTFKCNFCDQKKHNISECRFKTTQHNQSHKKHANQNCKNNEENNKGKINFMMSNKVSMNENINVLWYLSSGATGHLVKTTKLINIFGKKANQLISKYLNTFTQS